MSEHFNWVTGAVLPYINFALFLAMAIYFFRKPLNSMAQKRREDYDSMFAEAKRIKEAAETQRAELQQRIANLDNEIKALTENAKKTAAAEHEEAVQNAHDLASHLATEASRVAEAELENALRLLRKDIVEQVTSQVSQKFQTELDGPKQSALIDSRLNKIQSLGLGKAH